MAIRKSSSSGIPFGNDANRPANPQIGQPYFNGQSSRLELYTQATGWQNIVQETPAVVNIVGQLNQTTSSTLQINGTNFAAGAVAYAIGTDSTETVATTTSLVSVVEINAVFPPLNPAYEPYDIKVVNPSNLYGILYDAVGVNNAPVWSTAAGSLGTFTELQSVSVTVAATDTSDSTNSPLSYSVVSGALPGGLTLNSSTGVISGTASNVIPNTTYSFTIAATDGRNTAVTRAFSITVNDRDPVWSTGTTLPTFTRNVAYSTTVAATEDDSGAITYSLVSGALPTGLTLSSGGVISGTPTSSDNTSFTVRATVTASGTTSDRTFTLNNVGPNAPVWVTGSTITTATENYSYSFQLSATDDSGAAPTYSLASGSMPSGLSLSSSGLISGTPSTNGSFSINFRATDANGTFTDKAITLPITAFASAYIPISFNQVTYSGGSNATWTVPTTGSYEFELAGANGGSSSGLSVTTYGGRGRIISVKYNLVAGAQVRLVAGTGMQMNGQGDSANGGGQGGGGSFVWLSSGNNLIAAAGGGGGGSIHNGGSAPYWYGTAGQPLGATSGSAARNGTAGGTNGGDGNGPYAAKGWNSMISSGDFSSRSGWYGVTSRLGGGGGPADGSHAGGGGGGYSGGASGQYGLNTGTGNADGRNGGGGGGTYVNPSNRGASDLGTHASDGYITVRAASS